MSLVDEISKVWWHDGHLNEDQRDFLIGLLTSLQPKFCIETGFATGRSTVTTLIAAQPERLISIDINLDYMGARSHAAYLMSKFNNLQVIEQDSSRLLTDEFFNANFPSGIDFAFVDGSHTYHGALVDMRKIYNRMNVNGVMVVDDFRSGPPNGCSIPDVDRAVEDFEKESSCKLEAWYKDGKGFAIFRKSA